MGGFSDIVGGIFGGSKGGGGSGVTSGYNMLPQNLKGIVDYYLNTAQGLSKAPYQAYEGDRIAPLSNLEQVAANYAQQNFGQAQTAIQGANNLNAQLTQKALAGPTLENISSYMSPYQQAVIDQTKRESVRDFEMNQLPGVGRAAAGAGAFGGSRQALLESEAYRNLNRNLTDIQERGSQAAFTNAQDQYFKSLQTSGDLAKTTAQTALLGQQAVGSDVDLLTKLGQNQRGITQAGLDLGYTDFQNQLNYPVNALNILGSAFSNVAPYFAPAGVPSGSSGGSSFGNLLNTGMQLGSLFGLFSHGGEVKSPKKYATGGQVITWDDGSGSTPWKGQGGTAGKSYLNTLFDLLSGGGQNNQENLSTEALAKAYGQAAEDTLLLEKEERDSINRVGDRISQNKFQPLYSPYLTEQTLANELLKQSHANLFAEGGQIPKPVKPQNGFTALASTILTKPFAEGGLVEMLNRVEQAIPGPVDVANMIPSPSDAFEALKLMGETNSTIGLGIEDILKSGFKAFTRPNNAKAQTAVGATPQLGAPNKTQQQVAEALSRTGDPSISSTVGSTPTVASTPSINPQASGSQPEDGSVSRSIQDIFNQLGIESTEAPQRPKESSLLTLLGTLGAYGGTPVSGNVARQRALAAAYGANQANVDNTQKQDQVNMERKIKAIKSAAEIQQLQNSQDWLKFQQALMAAKTSGSTGKKSSGLKDVKDRLAIEKALLDIQKKKKDLSDDPFGAGSPASGNVFDPSTGTVKAIVK